MVLRAFLTLAVMALLWPHEPDVGLQSPASPIELQRIHSALLSALDRVRTDLKSGENAR